MWEAKVTMAHSHVQSSLSETLTPDSRTYKHVHIYLYLHIEKHEHAHKEYFSCFEAGKNRYWAEQRLVSKASGFYARYLIYIYRGAKARIKRKKPWLSGLHVDDQQWCMWQETSSTGCNMLWFGAKGTLHWYSLQVTPLFGILKCPDKGLIQLLKKWGTGLNISQDIKGHRRRSVQSCSRREEVSKSCVPLLPWSLGPQP